MRLSDPQRLQLMDCLTGSVATLVKSANALRVSRISLLERYEIAESIAWRADTLDRCKRILEGRPKSGGSNGRRKTGTR